MDAAAMVALLVVLVAVLIGGFALAWKRDKSRSDNVSHRTEPDDRPGHDQL